MIYICSECKKELVDLSTPGKGTCRDFVCNDCLGNFKEIIAKQAGKSCRTHLQTLEKE